MSDLLLLHGMCVGAWEWERVIPALKADPRAGRVIAPDFPGRAGNRPNVLATARLGDYFDTALAALREHDLRDVVIVGHSGGGATMQALAAAEPERVRRLVFLCAAVPKRGGSLLDLQPLPLRLISRLLLALPYVRNRGIVPNKRLAKRAMCHDLPPADCDPLIQRLVPEPRALLRDRIDWPAERMTAPVTYILTTKDRIIRPRDQQKMARSLPRPEILRLPMGHARPVVEPARLVELLLRYCA